MYLRSIHIAWELRAWNSIGGKVFGFVQKFNFFTKKNTFLLFYCNFA